MNKYRYLPGAALLLTFYLTFAASAQPASFSRIGFGARGIALGNAGIADLSGFASAYYNPALAPFAEQQTFEASAGLLSMDRNLQYLQFAAPLKPRAGLAIGLTHAGVSNIDGRDASGYHTGMLSVDEYAGFLAFGTRLGRKAAVGVSLQLFNSNLYKDVKAATSLGIDLGLLLRPTDRLTLGLVADDLLARYRWDTGAVYGSSGKTTTDRFPTRIRVGMGYDILLRKLQVLGEYESFLYNAEHRTQYVSEIGSPDLANETESLTLQQSLLKAGVEYHPIPQLALRAGIRQDQTGTVRGSAGFGIEQPVGELTLRAEYGLTPEPYDAGFMHFITLRVLL